MCGWLDAYEVRCARRTRELADTGRSEPAAAAMRDLDDATRLESLIRAERL